MRHQAQTTKRSLNHALVMVHDQPQPCPYLVGRQARMPLNWPTRPVDLELMDEFLDAGFRRSGAFLYRTQCDKCFACEPARVDVDRFVWTKSLRRVLRRGDECLKIAFGQPQVDCSRLELLNKHRFERELSLAGGPLDESDYRSFLIETCCETLEMTYFLNDKLVAVATIDLGKASVSAVYCFFDTDHHRLSLGTYSILKQIEFAKNTSRQYLYLGMYVAANKHLSYKSRFVPQQRRVDGQWIWFDQEPKPT